MGITVHVLGVPKRSNSSCGKICQLNKLLMTYPCYFHFIGIGNNMSTETVLLEDGVHLNAKGYTHLRTIIIRKINNQ